MSCGRGRAEDCRLLPLCGAVISPPESENTRLNVCTRVFNVAEPNSNILRSFSVLSSFHSDPF